MKRQTNLTTEDLYEDIDCAEYEMEDYYSDTDEAANDENTLKHESESDISPKGKDEEVENLYNIHIDVERGEASKQRYSRLAQIARTGTEEEKKQAREEACIYMNGFVKEFINRNFRNYVEKDPSFAEDLEHEAYINIMKYLPEYDAEKGAPTTFFHFHILSAMTTVTNQMKHSYTSAEAALRRKIRRIRAEYQKIGREPTLADYMIEMEGQKKTRKSMSNIKTVLRLMELDTNTHLEAIEGYDQLIPGDSTDNSGFDTPENIIMKKMMFEGIVGRMHELFSDEEINIFFRNAIDNESIPSIAKDVGGKNADDRVRRQIEYVRHTLAYDSKIRSLCAGYVKNTRADVSVVTLLPIDDQNRNMDILEHVAL